MPPLAYQSVLAYACQAVQREYDHPYHGRLSSYQNQAVLDDVLNHFNALTFEEDEDLIRDAVREAECELEERLGIDL